MKIKILQISMIPHLISHLAPQIPHTNPREFLMAPPHQVPDLNQKRVLPVLFPVNNQLGLHQGVRGQRAQSLRPELCGLQRRGVYYERLCGRVESGCGLDFLDIGTVPHLAHAVAPHPLQLDHLGEPTLFLLVGGH